MLRVVIIGNSGSGKTTLARALAGRLGVAHIELDALHHQRGWVPAAPQDLLTQLREQLDRGDAAGGGWVACGQLPSRPHHAVDQGGHAGLVGLPRRVVMTRVLRRSARRVLRAETLWNGKPGGLAGRAGAAGS